MKERLPQFDSKDPAAQKGRLLIPVDIRFSDTDANGHVFFGTYFTLFDTAFLSYLTRIGYSFNRFLENDINFFYAEANTQYKSPLKFGDDLAVAVWVSHLGKTSFTIQFEALNQTNKTLAALGRIVAVVVDKTTEKPCPIPEEFIQALDIVGP